MLRHERMTVAMALAEFSHHSSRGQRMARAGVWGHEQNYTAKTWKPPTPQPELFSLEEEPGGGLPAPLSEVAGRQEKVERHVVDDLGELAPLVQILDLPVPQSRLPSRLSKCPRSLALRVLLVLLFLSRRRRNSWWKCRLCCLLRASLCRSRSRSSAFDFRRVVVASGVFKVLSQDRVQQLRILLANAFLGGLWSRSSIFQSRLSSRSLTFSPGDGLGQGSASSAGAADEGFTGFFSHFSPWKKVRSACSKSGPGECGLLPGAFR